MPIICCGLLTDVHGWFLHLCLLGQSCGYFPKPSKCLLLLHPLVASDIFGDSGMQIVTGHRFLGGFIGQ